MAGARVLLFLIALFSLASCSREETNVQKKLARTWTSSGSDTLKINAANGEYAYSSKASSETGTWALQNDSLLLSPFQSYRQNIDSLELHVSGNENTVHLFSGDSLAAYLSEGNPIVPSNPRVLIIEKLNASELILSQKGVPLRFTPSASTLLKSGFTVKSIFRGILGLISLVFIAWLFSSKRRAIDWGLVGKGLLLQVCIALAILKVPFIEDLFTYLSKFFVEILNFTRAGSSFVFGGLVQDINSFGFIFAFQVLPTIIFFSALTSLLFYLRILQRIVWVFAWLMKRIMNLSGAESLAAAGNVFLGQTESPLLVKPYISRMTKSELLCLMSGGMATIAGGVLAAYIGFLGGNDPEQELFFAKHLLAASVMSAPAAIVAAKLLMPETEKFDEKLEVSNERIGNNVLEAIANGTTEGLKLAVNVGAMLVVFIAFIAMANFFLENIIGDASGLNGKVAAMTNGQYSGLNLQFILGYSLRPIAWLMGTNWADSALVGQLLGEKTILNEFVAYVSLGDLKNSGAFVEQRSVIIATYMLCGFSNFASIGIQIGGIGVLAPDRKTTLSQLGMRALLGGTLACLFTAVVVGMFY